ncbi:helix-turn-helix domain-containing protein [Bacillus cereus]|uniref:helix-turn-helix domain-containing protein n=1 Tax=Bacillus cereus TaxID=1396 RepID=UPI001D0D063A
MNVGRHKPTFLLESRIKALRTIGCSRLVFNRFLTMWNHTYKEAEKGLTYHFFL